MSKITKKGNHIFVPDHVTIPYIEGDGVGHEITPVSQKIVNAAIKQAYNGTRSIEWKEVLAGEKAFKQTGSWLPDETMEAFREYIVGIKGPLTTPIGGGIRSLNVALRQTLDLYVCLRPVRWFKGVVSPVKEPQKVNMYIFRENTEDIYAGIVWQQGTPEAQKLLKFLTEEMGVKKIRFPETSSFGIKPVSVEGTERLVRAAIEYAILHQLPSVTLVHKGNIMKFTEGGFKLWGYALAEREFADLTFTWPQYEKIKKVKLTPETEEFFKNCKMDIDWSHVREHQGKLFYLKEDIPEMKKVRILRKGLYLGEMKKGRFEPSQSFAVALSADEYKPYLSFDINDENTIKYLKCETLDVDTATEGIHLIGTNEFPLGWAKIKKGRLKNKYSSSWRWL